MDHSKIVVSIWYKIKEKNPLQKFNSILTKEPISNFPLRICIIRDTIHTPFGHHKTGGVIKIEDAFKIVSKNYTTATNIKLAAGVKFLNFNTEQERYNAWQSYLTKFARFCICMDESTKLAPYMGDYTEPWTDERFKQYFGLTDIEWQLIDTVIKD